MHSRTNDDGSASNTAPPVRALYPINEAQIILGLSRATIYRLIDRRSLDSRRVLGRRLITRASIERLCAEGAP
jgi:excisionase family DNA binding protein